MNTPDTNRVVAMKNLIDALQAEIQKQAEDNKSLVSLYTQHVFDGKDPSEIPGSTGYAPWWDSPLQPFATRIVNEYRRAAEMPENPCHPASPAFVIFDLLIAGEWVPAAELSRRLYGRQVGSTLRPNWLKEQGYELLKEKIDGAVHYKIAKLQEVAA